MPIIGRKFCALHENSSPHITFREIYDTNPEILTILRDRKYKEKRRLDEHSEDIFTIIGIHGKKVTAKGKSYLLSWEHCPDERTWVSSSLVPKLLTQAYEKKGPQETPKPRVKEEISTGIHGVKKHSIDVGGG